MAKQITDEEARDLLGIDHNNWILQLNDEQLRMLQEIMAAEQVRRDAVFDGLREKIDEIG